MPNTLLVIDGPAVLYRAFFGLPDSITDDDGHPINALLGSVNQALWCVQKYDPRAVVWCFGAEAGEYRVEAFPAYHADRPPMPDPLEWQWERAPALYEALGWSLATTDDLEADDLLHSLCEVETAAGGTSLTSPATATCSSARARRSPSSCSEPGGEGPEEIGPEAWWSATASSRHRSRTSSPCAATRPTGCRGRGDRPEDRCRVLKRKGDLEHVILGAIREKPAVRRALIDRPTSCAFKDIATLRTIPVERPSDAPTDYARGARAAGERAWVGCRAARGAGSGGLNEVCAERALGALEHVAREVAAPVDGAHRRAGHLTHALGDDIRPGAIGVGQQREQVTAVPGDEEVGAAQEGGQLTGLGAAHSSTLKSCP